MSNIKSAFANGKALIPFITCADPDLETTAAAIRAAVENGADLIELGIPFSDPTAEGPVVQESNIRALSGGVTTDRIFGFVRELRREVRIPLVFVTYANVVFSYGAERFISRCGEIGIDGLMVPDLPYEERDEFLPLCRKFGVDLISTVVPAAESRMAMIAREAEGFLCVAGGGDRVLRAVRRHTGIPCVMAMEEPVAEHCDGAVAGSPVVRLFEKYGRNAPAYVGAYVRDMKARLCG